MDCRDPTATSRQPPPTTNPLPMPTARHGTRSTRTKMANGKKVKSTHSHLAPWSPTKPHVTHDSLRKHSIIYRPWTDDGDNQQQLIATSCPFSLNISKPVLLFPSKEAIRLWREEIYDKVGRKAWSTHSDPVALWSTCQNLINELRPAAERMKLPPDNRKTRHTIERLTSMVHERPDSTYLHHPIEWFSAIVWYTMWPFVKKIST